MEEVGEEREIEKYTNISFLYHFCTHKDCMCMHVGLWKKREKEKQIEGNSKGIKKFELEF